MERLVNTRVSASSFVTDEFRRVKHSQHHVEHPWTVTTSQPHRRDDSDWETDKSLLIVLAVISCVTGVLFVVQCVVYARYFIQRRRRASIHLQPVLGGVNAYGERKAAVVATSGRFSKTGPTSSGNGGGELHWQSEIFSKRSRTRSGAKMVGGVTSRRAPSSAGRKSIFSISSASSSSNSTRRSPNYEMATPYPCTLTETITSQSERDLSHRVSDASRATSSSRHTVRRSTSSLAGKSRLGLTLTPVLWAEEGEVPADMQLKENPGYDTESTSSHDKPITTSSSTKPMSSSATDKMTSRSHSNASDSSREETTRLDLSPMSVINLESSGCRENNPVTKLHMHHPQTLDKNGNELLFAKVSNSSNNDSSNSSMPSSRVPSDSEHRLGKVLGTFRDYQSHSSSAEGQAEPRCSMSDNDAAARHSRHHRHLHVISHLQAASSNKNNASSAFDEHAKEVTSRWMFVSGGQPDPGHPGAEKRRRRRKKKAVIRQPKGGGRKAISLGGLWPESLLPL